MVLVILLAVLAAPIQAQEAGPSGGDLSDMPSRTLVDVPVPSEPRLPGVPVQPTVIAERWFAAASDEARLEIVLEVLAGIGLGVYTIDGTPILFGAEQGVDDPWLHDFEVALLAADPATVPATTVADIAAALEGVLADASGSPIEAGDLAEFIRSATEEALADEQDPLGFPLRLARELEMAASGMDLAEEVPVDEQLTSLAAVLIGLDILMPFAAVERTALTATRGDYMPVAAHLPSAALAAGLLDGRRMRTAQLCGRIGSWAGKKSWDVGKLGARMIVGGVRLTGLTPPAQAAHALFLRHAIRVSGGASNTKPHYVHPGQDPSAASAVFRVQVLVDVDLPSESRMCGALAGLRLPKAGPLPGIPVDWHTGLLEEHGTIECPTDGCLETDSAGRAALVFEPKKEPAPAGLGPEEYDRALVVSRVKHHLDLGNVFGLVPISGAWAFRDVRVSWHRPYRFELEIDSKIVTGGYIRSTATARGRIEIRDQGDGYLLGAGTLKLKTTPLQANGCKGEASAKGGGSNDWEARGLTFPTAREVTLNVAPLETGDYPDRLTRPACPGTLLRKAVSRFSTWEHHFFLSHEKDTGRGVGFFLDDWTWKADEETFRTGGLLATLDTPENCKGRAASCQGVTHFKLYVYPIDD